jgi:tRNA-dihydrouridine synthase A
VAYQNPDMLVGVDPLVFGQAAPVANSFEAVETYIPYLEAKLAEGVRLHDMTRHMLGLFTGLPGARAWRRTLATKAVARGAGIEVVREALGMLSHGALVAEPAQA